MTRSQWPAVLKHLERLSMCSASRAVPVHVVTRDQTLVTGAVYGPERDVVPLWTQIKHKHIQKKPITTVIHTD